MNITICKIRKQRKVAVLILSLLLFGNTFGQVSAQKTGKTVPALNGSFVQNWIALGWDNERWNNEMALLKSLGMEYLVLDQAVEYKGQYISWFPVDPGDLGVAAGGINWGIALERCMNACRKNGIRIFIGTYFNPSCWDGGGISNPDKAKLFLESVEISNRVMDMIKKLYLTNGTKGDYSDVICGWYWPWEVDDVNFSNQTNLGNLKRGLQSNLTHRNKITPNMPIMMCPFMNGYGRQAYRPASWMDADQYSAMWLDIFKTVDFRSGDIFAPQDCRGTEKLTIDDVGVWMPKLSKAVSDAGKDMKFWIDVETFGPIKNTSLTELKASLAENCKYASNLISFSYTIDYSPHSTYNYNDPALNQAYKNYYESLDLPIENSFIDGKNALITMNMTVKSDSKAKNVIIKDGGIVHISDGGSLTIATIDGATKDNLIIERGGASLVVTGQNQFNATVNQSIEKEWQLMAIPISNGQALDYFTGFYLHSYDETKNGWTVLQDKSSISSFTGYSLGKKSGTALSFAGNIDNRESYTYRLSYSGAEVGGNYARGWNLFGNSWLGAIDMGKVNYNSPVYVYDGTALNYLAYTKNTGGGTLPNGIIPPLQGFFVKANSAGESLTINRSALVAHNAPLYKSDVVINATLPLIRIAVTGGEYTDKIVIAEHEDCDSGYNEGLDAYKLYGDVKAPQLYTYGMSDNDLFTVNSVRDFEKVYIGFEKGEAADYTISWTIKGIESSLYLMDTQTGKTIDMQHSDNYSFISVTGDITKRFIISRSTNGVDNISADQLIVTTTGKIIKIKTMGNTSANIVLLYDITGRLVKEFPINNSELETSVETAGIYIIRLGKLSRKVIVK